MSMTDPIADYFTRIRNALMAGHAKLDIPCSNLKCRISGILKEEGFIREFKQFKDNKQGILRVYLKYKNEVPVIRGIKRISKPGRRTYVSKDTIPRVLNGLGVALVSTSKGVLTDEDCRKNGIGGEVLGFVW
jgi:small subunit ribosomal protein S8